MRILLDTHVYIWTIVAAEKLSLKAHAAIADEENELCVSVASLWEATIKIAKGTMQVPGDRIDFPLEGLSRYDISVIPISLRHLQVLQTLPPIHRDPFDRVLIAQSIAEVMPLISADEKIRSYDVDVVW